MYTSLLIIFRFNEKGAEQTFSFIEIPLNSNSTIPIFNNEELFYNSQRLPFLDDMINNDLIRRIIVRFWVFYQIHSLNRGAIDY